MAGFQIKNVCVREALAEFIGIAILIIIGDGSVAQSVLSQGANGMFLSINISWAIGVIIGVHVCVGVSGGHINPAISLVQFCLGNLSFPKLLIYTVSQVCGAFFGAFIVWAVYFEALEAFDGGVRQVLGVNGTAGIFATYPAFYLSHWGGLLDQAVGTALLAMGVVAVTDKRNKVPPHFVPLLVGLVVLATGAAFGLNAGYAINPARDFGPRLFTFAAGWGWEVFSLNDYHWFWVPIVGPYLGALIGAALYKLLIGVHWPDEDDEDDMPPSDLHAKFTFSKNINRF